MNDPHERYLESALDEYFQGGPEPDLPERILLRDAGTPKLHVVRDKPARKRHWLYLQAACAVLALGVIALVLVPREDDKLPGTVVAETDGYHIDGNEVTLEGGWYVLETGAPVVKTGDSRIEQVIGRAIVKTGEIPDETELQAHTEWLRQHGVEEEMLSGNWIKVGGMAVCLLVGSAVIDGQAVHAQQKDDAKVETAEVASKVSREARIQQNIDRVKAELAALQGNKDADTADKERKTVMLNLLQDMKDSLTDETRNQIRDSEETMSVEYANKDIRLVVADLSDKRGLLISIQQDVQCSVTATFTNAKPADILRTICRQNNLKVIEDGEVFLIVPAKADEEDFVPDPNAPITVDFVQKDLHTVLHYIALRSGLQIIVEGDLDVKLTVMFRDIDPKEVIRSICKANKLEMVEDGNVIIVRQGKSDQAHVTPSVPREANTPINAAYEDEALDLVLIDLQKRGGLDIVNKLTTSNETSVTLSMNKIAPATLLKLICDDCDLRLVHYGDTYYVREQLTNMTKAELEKELNELEVSGKALENRIQFLTIAIEAAQEEGDKKGAAEFTAERTKLETLKKAMEADIESLKKALDGK